MAVMEMADMEAGVLVDGAVEEAVGSEDGVEGLEEDGKGKHGVHRRWDSFLRPKLY